MWELGKHGFRRTAVLHRLPNGEIETTDFFTWTLLFGNILSSLIFALLAILIGLSGAFQLLTDGTPPLFILAIAGAVVGVVSGLALINRTRFGIERRILDRYGHCLMPGESALISQSPVETMKLPMALIRDKSESLPTIFVLHASREHRETTRSLEEPISDDQILERACKQARGHKEGQAKRVKPELLIRLKKEGAWFQEICVDLADACRLEQGVSPVAEWIIDNEFLVARSIRDVLVNLPKGYYRELPVRDQRYGKDLPCIYELAKELIFTHEARITAENIVNFVNSYQKVNTLSIAELWALPQMLRVALVESILDLAIRVHNDMRERQLATFWANRFIAANRRDSALVFSILGELDDRYPEPTPYFCSQLVNLLYDQDSILAPVENWIERKLGKATNAIELLEQKRQARDEILIENSFSSIRKLTQLDWRELFEQLAIVEKILRTDPQQVYAGMDFETRDRYRQTVKRFAERANKSEHDVAQLAIDLAVEHDCHIGEILIGSGKKRFESKLGCMDRPGIRLRERLKEAHSLVYLGSLAALFLPIVILTCRYAQSGKATCFDALFILLLLIPASQLAIEILNYLLTRLLSPLPLPKMDFEKSGIPDRFRTLVVIPTLLASEKAIRHEVEQLEIRFMANRDANLRYSLFTDFTDSAKQDQEDDEKLLQLAVNGIKELNRRYNTDIFFLFHRERSWCDTEQKYIGWERKRGKLEELNQLLDGSCPDSADRLVYAGNPERLDGIRFIITLDSDTQLPHGTARRMIETLSHPLNSPQLDAEGRINAGTYSILQPRVTPSLKSTSSSPFSQLFADAVGVDPYTKVVSDVYQDLTGEGSYHGKGIYDVKAFSKILSGNFPDGLILSHDLIEGAHVRTGLVSDIELFDEFPQDYLGYVTRMRRWIRGDWQIAAWVLPWVPKKGGGFRKNPISIFNRWKVFDNLRRSLLSTANLALLITAWLSSQQAAVAAMLLVGVEILFHPLSQVFTALTTRNGIRNFSSAIHLNHLQRALAEVAMMPHQAWISISAIMQSFYRLFISKRKLLEWTTAYVAHTTAMQKRKIFTFSLILASLSAAAIWASLARWMPGNLPLSYPWLLLWFASPFFGWLLTSRPIEKPLQELLAKRDLRYLRQVNRLTWRFFDDFVNENTSWLPPDNYQVSHQNQLAMRTSPTNIGFSMLSTLAASDSGYIPPDQTIDRLAHTVDTLEKVERYEGHLLNWYDIGNLQPLEPRYVSAVDSGNFLGALWALQQGLHEQYSGEVISGELFEGLRDSADILHQTISADPEFVEATKETERLLANLDRVPKRIVDRLQLLRLCEHDINGIDALISAIAPADSEPAYWSDKVLQEARHWRENADLYLEWIELLGHRQDDELARTAIRNIAEIADDLTFSPSLHNLSRGVAESIPILTLISEHAYDEAATLSEWASKVLASFAKAQHNARMYRVRYEQLLSRLRKLAGEINLRFLFDKERKLFTIGYNVTSGHRDNSYYDLLASEARFGGFVAIARGDVPMEHWFTMGRPHAQIGRDRVLLSWTGTMFEYLMPQLFLRSYRYSLLDKAARDAIDVQIDYGRRNKIPWGISESAFGDLDFHKTYQYKAFGVPKLGLKRILEEQLVVSPYSTLMAVGIAPQETVDNLRNLDRLGMLNQYGFYESIDFRRKSKRGGRSGVMIKAYMSHHQGMGFIALANFLHNNLFQRRFHADPRVRAFEPLLQEKIPTLPPLQLTATRDRAPSLQEASSDIPASGIFETPNTSTPKSQMICNGRYDLLVTNTGGGYSKWNGQEITRWRSDRTNDQWGTYCYLHDLGEKDLWSSTFHPIDAESEDYIAEFALDRAIFRRSENGVQVETEVIVAPEDDIEIRRMTLTNRTSRRKRINLTSYVELSMADHAADRAHPAFNKLFIQTEAIEEERTLLAYRRLRSEDAEPLFVAHSFVNEKPGKGMWHFETDRSRFIGRGHTLADARGATGRLSNSAGFVLDPVLCLRETVTLEPSQKVSLAMTIAADDDRDKVLETITKYRDIHAINRAMDFAWRAAQIELRQLHILPDEARRFQQLADHLIFPNTLLRAPAETLEENHKGQQGLWPYAISGDLPILLVSIEEARDIGLIRQLLQAQAYWRRHGFLADLVILNEEGESYEQPLRERLVHLIQAHSMYVGRDQPSGIYLRSSGQMPEEDLRLLKAAASVFMVAARGSLSQQLGTPRRTPDLPKTFQPTFTWEYPSEPLPEIELVHHNGYGGFTPDGREYVIELPAGKQTPAPWVNVMANPDFGAMTSETGAGFSWFGNSQRNRINGWSNDTVIDPPSEAIYIRDEVSGRFWTATSAPVRNQEPYRCRHGAGYSIFEHNHSGIDAELTLFVPVDEVNSPVKLQRLRLRNTTSRRRALTISWYTELTLGENRESSQMHGMTHWDSETSILLAHNHYHPDYGGKTTFFAMSPKPTGYCGDRTIFIGRNRSLRNPQALQRTELAQLVGAGLDPCAALQTKIDLAPGEVEEIVCIVGQADSIEQARLLARSFRDHSNVDAALKATCRYWDDLLGTIEVETPDPRVDILVNRWLLYQSLSCRIWGRSAFYQSGGAFGFRDQLQDVLAFLFTKPELAKEQIRLAASRQFKEGDVQHWWHPPGGAGIRSRISDDLLWLPYVTIYYVRATGDLDILSDDVPFLTAPELAEDEHEVFAVPEETFERGTIFEHCRRAVHKGLTAGPDGLPLIGTGDWNDGMNLVGAKGRGESIWLAWFLVDILHGMAELSDLLGKPELEQEYRQKRATLIRQIEEKAWDGAWYRRGTFDDGSPLGSRHSDEAKIDSLPQSWAWLTGAGDRQRAEQALESAWDRLFLEEERLVLLFEPPFNKSAQNPGYIKGYPPGVRENGGQYTHAALWFAMAMARRGDGNRAVKMLQVMSPMEHARDREAADLYGLEPYAIAADIYRLPDRTGKGGWSWYTGSAAWTYRAWVEEILGLHIARGKLHIRPVIPEIWKEFTIRYRHDGATFVIHVRNPDGVMQGVKEITMNGNSLPDKTIPLTQKQGEHRIDVLMGKG